MSKRQDCLDAVSSTSSAMTLGSKLAILPPLTSALGYMSPQAAFAMSGMIYTLTLLTTAGGNRNAIDKCGDLPFNLRELRERLAKLKPITRREFKRQKDGNAYLFTLEISKTSGSTKFEIFQQQSDVYHYQIKINKADLKTMEEEGELQEAIFLPLHRKIRSISQKEKDAGFYVASDSDDYKDVEVAGDEELAEIVRGIFPRD